MARRVVIISRLVEARKGSLTSAQKFTLPYNMEHLFHPGFLLESMLTLIGIFCLFSILFSINTSSYCLAAVPNRLALRVLHFPRKWSVSDQTKGIVLDERIFVDCWFQ